jgi:hypothetical protein
LIWRKNFVAGGIIISLGARKPTYLPGVYNTAKIGYGFLYAWGMWTIVSITIALICIYKRKLFNAFLVKIVQWREVENGQRDMIGLPLFT